MSGFSREGIWRRWQNRTADMRWGLAIRLAIAIVITSLFFALFIYSAVHLGSPEKNGVAVRQIATELPAIP